MSRFARVDSVDTLKAFRDALRKFAETAKGALFEVDWEIQRTANWLERDQHAYWKRQVRKRTELVAQAKLALMHKQLQKMPGGGRYSCIEEKKALALAKRRLEEAERKFANVQRWKLKLKQEASEYKSQIQGMEHAIEAEVPNAVGKLDRMLQSLESYVSLTAPEGPSAPAGGMAQDMDEDAASVSVSRSAPPHAVDRVAAYRKLRNTTPQPDVLEKPPQAGECAALLEGHQIVAADLGEIEGLGIADQPVGAEARVVLAKNVWAQRRVYLERVQAAADGRCRSYVGPVDQAEVEVEPYVTVRSEDLLAKRPEWRTLLQLPEGYLVVVDGDTIEAVLGPDDDIVWCPKRVQ